MDKLLVITEHCTLQSIEYWRLINKFDILIYGITYIIPKSELFTHYLYVDNDNICASIESYPFGYFCDGFKGTHLFVNDAHSQKDKCIAKRNILKYKIINRHNDHHDPLHSIIMPYAMDSYSTIVIAGIPLEDKCKFHEVRYIQPHLNKMSAIEDIDVWDKWVKLARDRRIKLMMLNGPHGKIAIEHTTIDKLE